MDNSDRIEDLKWLKAKSGFGYQACFDMYKSCNEDKYEALRRLEALKVSEASNDITPEEYEKFKKYRDKYLEKDAKRITNEEWRKRHKHLKRPTAGRWIGTVIGLFFFAWVAHIVAVHIEDAHPWIILLAVFPLLIGEIILMGVWLELPETTGTYQVPKQPSRRKKGQSFVLLAGLSWLIHDIFREAYRKKRGPFDHTPGYTKDDHR